MSWVVLVCRVIITSAGMFHFGADHAIEFADQLLDTPETTTGKDCHISFHAYLLSQTGEEIHRILLFPERLSG
jgi:hypothetical protein